MESTKQPQPLSDAELERRVRAGTEELLVRVWKAYSGEERWVDGMRALGYEMLRFLREDPERAHMMVIEVLDSTQKAMEIREFGMNGLIEIIDLGRGELDDPESMPRSVAEIIAGAVYNRLHVSVEREPEAIDAEMVRELMYTTVLPYLGPEVALTELERPPPQWAIELT